VAGERSEGRGVLQRSRLLAENSMRRTQRRAAYLLIACLTYSGCSGQTFDPSGASPSSPSPQPASADSDRALSSTPMMDAAQTAGIQAARADDSTQATSNAASTDLVTYHKDVRAIFERSCVECHGLQSRNVAFGEGSFEEMCLHCIWLRTPL
jgi:mono/diheme cytochrome c family protein